MANNNTPDRDFAPHWLKIPTYEPLVRPSSSSTNQRHTSRCDINNKYTAGSQNSVARDQGPLGPRNHYPNDSRRDRGGNSGDRRPNYLSPRHDHQQEEVDSRLFSNGSALRRPHSRHDFRNNIYSYGKNNSTHSSELLDNKLNGDLITVNFNQEFPSLLQDGEEPPVVAPVNGGVWENPGKAKVLGLGKKVSLTKKPSKENNVESNTNGCVSSRLLPLPLRAGIDVSVKTQGVTPNNNIYRAYIPATKSSLIKKREIVKSTITKEISTNGLASKGSATTLPSSSTIAATVIKKPSTTPPPLLDILVKNPKPKVKNEFLKSLRTEQKEKPVPKEAKCDNEPCNNKLLLQASSKTEPNHNIHIEETEEEDEEDERFEEETCKVNGIPINGRDLREEEIEKPLLSGSLEKERRLLEQMGWKDENSGDETFAPLTEDEIKEIKQKVSSQKKNGIHLKLWHPYQSPARRCCLPLAIVPPESDSDSSSSSSD